ncbi:MAG: OsmC family protein [Gammaproteobacteria bacterium]|nr:OsmC family protein [Gammaproteobacteria bacterium]
MKARIKLIKGMTFSGESGTGHQVIMDSAVDVGGQDSGPRPMEMVLLGLGGCSAIDVLMILRKARQQVDDCVIDIEAERANEDPKVFTKIHLHYVLKGENLSEKHIQRAISLSAEKYCSVSKMLEKTAVITHDHEIIG